MPNRTPVEVMQVWLDQDEMNSIVGGENARVKLKDISDEDIQVRDEASPSPSPSLPFLFSLL